jgi:hypothetical protein
VTVDAVQGAEVGKDGTSVRVSVSGSAKTGKGVDADVGVLSEIVDLVQR